jgi:hypothetical protein
MQACCFPRFSHPKKDTLVYRTKCPYARLAKNYSACAFLLNKIFGNPIIKRQKEIS